MLAAILFAALALAVAAGGADPVLLAAGTGAFAFLGLAALLRPDGMGMGDAKLAGVMGLALGPPVALALLVALGAGTLYGALAGARTMPFAPFLAMGAVGALVGSGLHDHAPDHRGGVARAGPDVHRRGPPGR